MCGGSNKARCGLPWASTCWNKADVNSDRRGVASWGLTKAISRADNERCAMQGRAVPLVDMQIRRHVGCQARSWRRPPHWLDGEVRVVHAPFPHAHVPEIEVFLPQCVSSKQRLRRWQVTAVAPRAGDGGRRVHGSQWRRHLHVSSRWWWWW